MTEGEDNEVSNDQSTKQAPMLTEEHLQAIGEIMTIKGKLSATSINRFYQQLDTLVMFVKNLKGIRDMYKYSDSMQVKLNSKIKELEFLIIEMSATCRNIQNLKRQKVNVTKDLKSLKETHEKKKREESQEMELVAAIYDKDLLRKWHIAKKATDVQTMENFINNLAGKKQAMDYVYKMALEKLTSLRKSHTSTPTMLQALFAKPLPPPIRSDSEPDSFLNSTD